MEVAELLSRLVPPESTDEQWIDEAWESELMTIPEMPQNMMSAFENMSIADILVLSTHNIKELLKENARTSSNSASLNASQSNSIPIDEFWDALNILKIDYKHLLPIICYFISDGLNYFENSVSRHLGLAATNLYLSLLSIPGSVTKNFYHAIVYTYTLNTLKMALKVSFTLNTSSSSKGKKKTPKKQQTLMSEGEELDAETEENDHDTFHMTEAEGRKALTELVQVHRNLLLVLQTISFRSKHDAISHTAQQFAELTFLEHTQPISEFALSHQARPSSLAVNAFIGLQILCNPLHGSQPDLVCNVMKHILPLLLMTPQNTSINLAPRELTIVRDNALKFVGAVARSIKEPSWKGISILFQLLITRTSERVENRHRSAGMALELMYQLPNELRTKLSRWVFVLGNSEKPAHRLMALEMVTLLLRKEDFDSDKMVEDEVATEESISVPEVNTEGSDSKVTKEKFREASFNNAHSDDENTADESDREDPVMLHGKQSMTHRHMLGLVLYRIDDMAPSVRSKALSMLVEFTSADNQHMSHLILPLFVEPYSDNKSVEVEEAPFLSYEAFLKVLDHPQSQVIPGATAVVQKVQLMASDEKVLVRKAALHLLVNVAMLSPHWLSRDLLEFLSSHCRDPAMTVRKQMLQSMTDLLKSCAHHNLHLLCEVWLNSVLNCILDPELKVQEMVMEMLRCVLVDNLVEHSVSTTPRHLLPWVLLKLIPRLDMQNFLLEACHLWVREKIVTTSFISILQTHIDTENNEQAWMIISALVETLPITKPTFIYDYFLTNFKNTKNDTELVVLSKTLRLLVLVMPHLTVEQRKTVHQRLLANLNDFHIPVELLGLSMDVLAASELKGASTSVEGLASISIWCKVLLQNSENALKSHYKSLLLRTHGNEENLIRQICSIGDAVRVGNLSARANTLRILHSIIITGHESATSANLRLKQKKLDFVPSLCTIRITIVTLGKMALQSESTAHELLPTFGFLLYHSKDTALRHNILCALADLCRRYAVLVDPLVPRMASCLGDSDDVLKREALVLMVQLLQEDFIKLRHGLFYFLLRMLCDPNRDLQGIASFYLTECLLKKQPNAMSSNFLGSLFFFNQVVAPDNLSNTRLPESTVKLLSMTGAENKANRLKMYAFMLDNMNDDQRFEITHKLCMDILDAFSEDKLVLDQAGNILLGDTLAVLSSDEIRLHTLRSGSDVPADQVDLEDLPTIKANATVKSYVSAVVKKNVMVNILPVIRTLKLKLQDVKSPLTNDLMNYLRDLMRDYKSEIEDALMGDRQLAAEVMFDIRRQEEQDKATALAENPEVQTSESSESSNL